MKQLIYIFSVCLMVTNIHATTDFVPGIEDLPFPETFREQPDNTVNYDAPEGRIIYARGESASTKNMEKIMRDYTHTLKNLGWAKESKNIFHRGNESLSIHFEENKMGSKVISISLTPRPKKGGL